MDANDFNMYCECNEGYVGHRCDTRIATGGGDTQLFIICIVSAIGLFAILALSMLLCSRLNKSPCKKRRSSEAPAEAQANGGTRHEDADEQFVHSPFIPKNDSPDAGAEEAIALESLSSTEKPTPDVVAANGEDYSTTAS